jgi:FkbM family methyltransferase
MRRLGSIVDWLRRRGAAPLQPAPRIGAGRMAEAKADRVPRAYSGVGLEAQVVRVKLPRHEVSLYVTSDLERRWRCEPAAKEPWTVAWITEQVGPGDTFYDIGANVGIFSILAARQAKEPRSVYAFEPAFASYARLCDNLVLNKCDDLVVPIPIPLSNRIEVVTLRYRSLEPGQSGHQIQQGRPEGRRVYQQPLVAITLDELVHRWKLPLPTHVKLDVDGAEGAVIAGAVGVLGSPALRSVMIEIEHDQGQELTAALERLGLRLVGRHQRKKSCRSWYGLFRREERSCGS